MKIVRFLLILLVVGMGAFWLYQIKPKEAPEPLIKEVVKKNPVKPDVLNMTYDIDGDVFVVRDGKGEIIIPDSSTKNMLEAFGGVYGDIDGDGDTDAAVWLVNDPGGTGRFFYGGLVMNEKGEWKATNTIFLGDRIAPDNIVIKDGRVIYNFAERAPSDPMSADPSVKVNLWVYFDKNTGEMIEYEKRF